MKIEGRWATKRCSGCGGVFPRNREYFASKGRGKLASKCRPCERMRMKKKAAKYAKKYAEYAKEYSKRCKRKSGIPDEMKRCPKCKEVKLNSEFLQSGIICHACRAISKDKKRIRSKSRKAARRGKKGRFSVNDILFLKEKQRGRCVVCRRSIVKKFHIDHIISLKLGGGNERGNLQLLCPPCNLQKSAMLPEVFMRKRFLEQNEIGTIPLL